MGAVANPVIIVGAGGHGRVCADVAHASGREVAGFLDSNPAAASELNGIPVVCSDFGGLLKSFPPRSIDIFIAIGDNAKRLQLFEQAERLGYRIPSLIHPLACLSPSATIGNGTVVLAGCVINANTTVGPCCIVNTAASLDHDNNLGRAVQICPGVRAAGNVAFEDAAFIGTGAIVIPGRRVGTGAVVGAGSVVVRDVPNGARVVGNPARVMKSN